VCVAIPIPKSLLTLLTSKLLARNFEVELISESFTSLIVHCKKCFRFFGIYWYRKRNKFTSDLTGITKHEVKVKPSLCTAWRRVGQWN